MALMITASFVESCQLDVSWTSYCEDRPQKYSITLRDSCNRQERIIDAAAARVEDGFGSCKIQLNLNEVRSNGSSYNVSVKGSTLSTCSGVEGISASKVIKSGSQSPAVSATAVDATTLLSSAASANPG